MEPGDIFVLCSDGLHGYLTTEEIPSIVELGDRRAVDALIDLANLRGGKDNITVALVMAELPDRSP